jgi:hypothetical protein
MLRQAQLICLFVLLTVIVVLLVTDYASVASFFNPADFGVPNLGRGKLWLACSILSLNSVVASHSHSRYVSFLFSLNHQQHLYYSLSASVFSLSVSTIISDLTILEFIF